MDEWLKGRGITVGEKDSSACGKPPKSGEFVQAVP